MKICGVILSGGVSKRFEGDKALALVEGEPMIRRVAKALNPAVTEVWISVRDETRGERLIEVCRPYVAGFIVDDFPAGPLSGLLTAAERIEADAYLSCSNDVPRLNSTTVKKMVALFSNVLPSAMSVVWGNGSVETLIQAVQRNTLRNYLRNFFEGRKYFLRPSDVLRSCEILYLVHGANLTSDPFEFSNINTAQEIANPKPRGVFRGFVNDDLLIRNSSRHFTAAVTESLKENFFAAGLLYLSEAYDYLVHGVIHLSEHAVSDAAKMFERDGSDEALRVCQHFRRHLNELAEMR